MPEGTIAFGGEPLLTVEAPIIEAQTAETYMLTCHNHQTKIATKAAVPRHPAPTTTSSPC